MKKEMLINVSQPEECRIGIVEDGVLEELYIERASQENYTGNIYKGKIVNLEPSIQAAFVDFGVGRNGFLHISDVEPQYFRQGGFDPEEIMRNEREAARNSGNDRGRRQFASTRPRFKPPIQDIFRRGDEVLVQVIKEGIGAKGPTLSTYMSIPGRYLVLMPSLGRVGVSRKIEDETVRRRLKTSLLDLNPPKGLGFIVRTAGAERTRKELSRDMAYLMRLWKVIVRRLKKNAAPCDIYEESDIVIRTIRDNFAADVDAIYIDEASAYERCREFLTLVMPKYADRLHHYQESAPLYHKYRLDEEITQIQQRKVPLKNGGSIVIDSTEALVAIDVNSGSFRASDESAEETAYQLNLAAAKEIARQLRLRDLGGVIVNDFIDMRRERHRRGVEQALRDAVRRDRARTKILRTSPFGLVEMTRQRIRPSLKLSVFMDCPACEGRGMVKTAESMALEVIRQLILASHHNVSRVMVTVQDDVATYLNNKKRRALAQLEEKGEMTIEITGREFLYPEHLDMKCYNAKGDVVAMPAG